MTTLDHIKEAILALGDRTGSSVPAINKWIEANKKVCFELKMAVYTRQQRRLCHERRQKFCKNAKKCRKSQTETGALLQGTG